MCSADCFKIAQTYLDIILPEQHANSFMYLDLQSSNVNFPFPVSLFIQHLIRWQGTKQNSDSTGILTHWGLCSWKPITAPKSGLAGIWDLPTKAGVYCRSLGHVGLLVAKMESHDWIFMVSETWSSQMVTGSAPSLWLVQPLLLLSGRLPRWDRGSFCSK